MEFLYEFLRGSPVIELLAKSLIENKEEVRTMSSKKEEIGFENYLKRTIKSLKISGASKFRTQKISDVSDFVQIFVRN